MRIAGLCLLLLSYAAPIFPLDQAQQDAPQETNRNPVNVRLPGGPPQSQGRNPVNVHRPGGPPEGVTASGTPGACAEMSVGATTGTTPRQTDVDKTTTLRTYTTGTEDRDTVRTGVNETVAMDQESTYAGDTSNLPNTASPLPLVGGIGALALLVAAALQFRRSRSS